MSGNTGYGFIQGTGDYINLETELSLTLEEGTYYQIQIQGKATFCESTLKPVGGGTYWNRIDPFWYVKEDKDLWIKPYEGDTVYVNIWEK